MGANEKYEATMHGYVPSTEQIRNCYVQRWYEQTEKQSDAEFDRWLATVKAEAWDEAASCAPEYMPPNPCK